MAQGNLPGVSAANPTTKTVNEFLADIAAVVGAQDNPEEVRALSAMNRALDWIQNFDWPSMLTTGGSFPTVVGTANYAMQDRTRKIHTLRVSSGTERKIWYIRKEEYDERQAHQSSNGLPVFWTSYVPGFIKLLPTPDQVETISTTFYTFFPKIQSGATQIGGGFPQAWEDMLISRAQYYVAIGRGLRTDRLHMLRQDAEQARLEALMLDTNEHDENLTMESGANTSSFDYSIGRDDPSRWW